MSSFIRKRAFANLVSLLGPVVMVFFLSRLTGDSASLFLPVDATEQMREEFRQLHGFNDPLLTQFGRHVWDPLHLDFGASIRRARPAIDVVLEAFVWTLQLAVITMTLVAVAVIVVGLLAAFRAGGLCDRIAPLTSLIGASGPDFLGRHRRLRGVLGGPGLADHIRHWYRLAPDPADRRAVHPALWPDRAGGARLDDLGPVLRLGKDRPRPGGAFAPHHLRPRPAQRHAAGRHRDRRPGGGAAERGRRGRDDLRLPRRRQADDRRYPAT
ncbi:hypothetical protein BDE18_2735 [Paracoccus pantotrophus]|uniref:Uncharacterized protein n=1 Tax=Paracoccus pantotrophus TaxID=82367 RepID=A0ABX9S7K1_PARPN|nr:hypothetical protein BDE18_2735 [Paracoccus pantotrophus]